MNLSIRPAAIAGLVVALGCTVHADLIIGSLPCTDATRSASNGGGRIKAMGFTMPPGRDYTLDEAVIRLEIVGLNVEPLVRIFDDVAGAPTNELITLANPTITTIGTQNYVFLPPTRFVLEGGASYWLVFYNLGPDRPHWMANGTTIPSAGIATHYGSLWSGSSGPNPPPATATSSHMNCYEVHGTPAQPPCYPDCDGNGTLDFFDFLCFQNAFLAQDPYADCDQNGVFDFFDFLCFQNEFLAGCP